MRSEYVSLIVLFFPVVIGATCYAWSVAVTRDPRGIRPRPEYPRHRGAPGVAGREASV